MTPIKLLTFLLSNRGRFPFLRGRYGISGRLNLLFLLGNVFRISFLLLLIIGRKIGSLVNFINDNIIRNSPGSIFSGIGYILSIIIGFGHIY